MITKAPSRYDGKPVGTPTDAVSPYRAGVTMGPDQIERMEADRRERNRALKAARKARRREAFLSVPEDERERSWRAYKQRRNRADKMTRALRNRTPIPHVAQYYGITPDEVLADVKWLAEHRNSNRRHAADKRHPLLPKRGVQPPRSAEGTR